jgi:hypothetical protein
MCVCVRVAGEGVGERKEFALWFWCLSIWTRSMGLTPNKVIKVFPCIVTVLVNSGIFFTNISCHLKFNMLVATEAATEADQDHMVHLTLNFVQHFWT